MNNWTWGFLVVTSAIFGYWQSSIAAGFFMLLILTLVTFMLFKIVDWMVRIHTLLRERLEDPTGGCTGYRDCNCWWHTEQRRKEQSQQHVTPEMPGS